MNSLYQRLKELDSDSFERLCFHILKERFSNVELRHVEGKGGDEGLDVFAGQLAGRPTIWQCKSFPDGVREAQKNQIRLSLNSALANFSPAHWILCLSVDMDAKAMRWFDRWRTSNASRVKIGLFSASDIVNELLHRRTIRNTFFPGAAIDPIQLKQLLTKTGDFTLDELETITESNLELFVERWKEKDPRFNLQIIFDGDLGPPPPSQGRPPGLVMSITAGAKTINVVARDFEAIQANPPTLKVGLTGSGIEKFKDLYRTGNTQEFSGNEFASITSEWSLLAPVLAKHGPQSKLIIGPSPELTERKKFVRVTFRNRLGESIQYGLMTLRPKRVGSQEAEFVCSSEGLPFEIDVVFPPQILLPSYTKGKDTPEATISLRDLREVGSPIRQVKKFLDAKALLSPSGEIEIFDLREEQILMRATAQMPESERDRSANSLIDDLARIAERFGADLRIAADFTDEDWRSFVLLKTYIEGGSQSVENIRMTVEKSEENQNLLPDELTKGPGRFRVVLPHQHPAPQLFGEYIDTGPCAEEFEAEIVDLQESLDRFKAAAIGDGVELNLHPTSPVKLLLLPES